MAQTADLAAQRDGIVQSLAIETPVFTADPATALPWETEIRRTGAAYLRLHISGADGPYGDGTMLKLRDRSAALVHEYPAAELLERGPFWTVMIPGDYALLSLLEPTPGFHLRIDQIAFQAHGGAPLSTVGDDEKQPISDYADDVLISRIERPVAKLSFVKDGAPRTCTGFLIDTGQFMTNHHCIASADDCGSALAIFGYQYDTTGLLSFGEQFACKAISDGKTSETLDYAILDLDGNPAATWGSLSLDEADPDVIGPLLVIQHPAGQPKQISKINCAMDVVPVDGLEPQSDFTHSCDTVGGSSGSPVFDTEGRIVGLHHYGFAEGGPWSDNRAVRMKRILEDLAAHP